MPMVRFEETADYPVPATALWALVGRWDGLERAAGRLARYEGLPEGEILAGQEFVTRIRLFGIWPLPSWTIRVLARDDETRVLESEERGGAVRRWNHRLSIDALEPGRCRHSDILEIDAGWQTPGIAFAARRIYRARHKERRKLLGLPPAGERP